MSKFKDKLQHFIVFGAVVIVTYTIMMKFWPGHPNWWRMLGVELSMLGSFTKEWYDSKQPLNRWDWWDIAWDMAGIITALKLIT